MWCASGLMCPDAASSSLTAWRSLSSEQFVQLCHFNQAYKVFFEEFVGSNLSHGADPGIWQLFRDANQVQNELKFNCFLSGRKLNTFQPFNHDRNFCIRKLLKQCSLNWADRMLCTRRELAALCCPYEALDERHLEGVLVWSSRIGCSGLPPTEWDWWHSCISFAFVAGTAE